MHEFDDYILKLKKDVIKRIDACKEGKVDGCEWEELKFISRAPPRQVKNSLTELLRELKILLCYRVAIQYRIEIKLHNRYERATEETIAFVQSPL